MGFTVQDRARGRWPNRRVPFEVNDLAFPPGSLARQNIDAAINGWNATGVVSIVPRSPADDAYVLFGPEPGRCRSVVGFSGGVQTLACALRTDPVGTPGAATRVSLVKQTDDVMAAIFLGAGGSLRVASVNGTGFWELPAEIAPNVGVPDGPVAVAKQTNDILTVAFIDRDGFLSIAHVVGTGAWQRPVRVGGAVAPPGAPVSLIKQTDNTLTAVFVDQGGVLSVAWVDGTNPWNPAAQIGGVLAPPGAPVSLIKQTDNTLTAVFVDQGGVLSVAWVDCGQTITVVPGSGCAGIGQRNRPSAGDVAAVNALYIGNTALSGAPVALCRQTRHVFTAVFLDTTGTFSVAW